jgi:UDP-N-acetylmuramate: L-alanyl-gamma-D-glutamyl-meso-diaminopimelate ligase
VILAAVFRASLPDAERLSAEQLVEDLKQHGVRADHIPAVDDIVSAVARDAQPGDIVVGMSNGGFDDFHNKLLTALEHRAR